MGSNVSVFFREQVTSYLQEKLDGKANGLLILNRKDKRRFVKLILSEIAIEIVIKGSNSSHSYVFDFNKECFYYNDACQDASFVQEFERVYKREISDLQGAGVSFYGVNFPLQDAA